MAKKKCSNQGSQHQNQGSRVPSRKGHVTITRYLTKPLLQEANVIAVTRGYNRALHDELIQNVPIDVKMPVVFNMVHTHKAGTPCEPHMRVSFVLNELGTQCQIDCDMDLFNRLPLHFEVRPDLDI